MPANERYLTDRERGGLKNGELEWCEECEWPKRKGKSCANCDRYEAAMDYHDAADAVEGID